MASFSKAIIGVLGVALVVIAFVLLYAVFGKSTELRSKAAEAKTFTYKAWTFDTPGDTEGWWSQNMSLAVAMGALTVRPDQPRPIFQTRQISAARMEAAPELIARQAPKTDIASLKKYPVCAQIPTKDPFISSGPVSAYMPKGAKYVKLVVTANAPFVTKVEEPQRNRWGLIKRPSRRTSKPQAYGMQVYYAGNAKSYATPVTVPDTFADGKQHEFLVQVAEAGEEQARCLQVAFPNAPKGLSVSFDSISLQGQKVVPPQCRVLEQAKCIKAPCEVSVQCTNPPPLPPTKVTSTPTTTPMPPVPVTYSCPGAAFVDCMPGPGRLNERCGSAYIAWMQQNCPEFRGVAR